MKTVTDFIFLGSKITADGDCGLEIKKHLLLGRKVMTNPESILKSRDITLPTNIHVWMWELDYKESWVQRTDAFELWCWRRLLGVPWTSRRFNQSIRREISPEYSLEGLMLKLKLQYFGPLMWRTDSLEKTLMLGKIEGRRRRGRQRTRWLDGITDSMDMSLNISGRWWRTRKPSVQQSMMLQRFRHNWVTDQQQVKENLRPISLMNIRMKMLNKYQQIKSNNLHKNKFTLIF